jgi:drug/metabolite transporter (DMT)-like permease
VLYTGLARASAMLRAFEDSKLTLAGLLLVLTAAVCHATWNIFVKRINAGAELVWLFSVVSLVLYLPLAIWFAIGWTGLTLLTFTAIAVSTLIHLGYFLLLQTGYRKGDLSLVYPTARATGPLLSTTMAVLVLGESVTPQIAVGGAIIIFSVLMLTNRRGQIASEHAIASLGFGLGAGLLIGSYTVWDAWSVSVLLIPPLLLDYANAIARTVLLAPVAYRRWDRVIELWQTQRTGVFVIAIFSPMAYILVLYAMTFTPVIYVAPIRETSVLMGVLAGSLLLGEGHLRWRLTWAIVILFGVVLLAAG